MKWVDKAEENTKHRARMAGFYAGRTGMLLDLKDIPLSYHADYKHGWMSGVSQIPKECDNV